MRQIPTRRANRTSKRRAPNPPYKTACSPSEYPSIECPFESGVSKPHIRILQQVIPGEDLTNVFETQTGDRGSSKYASRPGFSLPLMTNNFRRFNARPVSFDGMLMSPSTDVQIELV